MFAVVEGEVELTHDDRVVEKVGPGGILGEMALIDTGPRSATATATVASRSCASTSGTSRSWCTSTRRSPCR